MTRHNPVLKKLSGFKSMVNFKAIVRSFDKSDQSTNMRISGSLYRWFFGNLHIDDIKPVGSDYQAPSRDKPRQVVGIRQKIDKRLEAKGKPLPLFADDLVFACDRYCINYLHQVDCGD